MKVKSLSHVWLFATPWTAAHQAPLSLEFSRQEYWRGLPFPSPGDIPDSGIEPRSPILQADSLLSEPPGHISSANLRAERRLSRLRPGLYLWQEPCSAQLTLEQQWGGGCQGMDPRHSRIYSQPSVYTFPPYPHSAPVDSTNIDRVVLTENNLR